MGNLSFLKLVKALGSIEPLGKDHVLVVLNDFHEILVAKHVMNFAHILVPLVYIFPLRKWHALQQFGEWVQVKGTHTSYFMLKLLTFGCSTLLLPLSFTFESTYIRVDQNG